MQLVSEGERPLPMKVTVDSSVELVEDKMSVDPEDVTATIA